ncbi:hypothetical protein GLOIN_2v991750 [Rhizophagus irregularis DAOM 181602=DAOM 197198]|uniref:Uncharacterized protein n=1 Tax=Rhizophagus irregularis (strain DAOM 181602 / DAOM 197198 / MUCL 43194) TaxID=747089 RepID=A0A2P4QC35_RHIID|nr:hypothetical protein GLOIN_2v991750 [Rhizophagus irregularis DAOM 181602=DAOM 197198]POG75201.1 hypothetical protein GLOIN_2v991750 [Rhizophagus irregularis DAOM 181602=DAOM 197198]GET55892.1 hypothetical protein GLOIN_2v991750 [Rhizophagus irregularis DAOM 181602=DAOM 197198]|eukprot:XP_025182067.1 hypothetical protein GLOIN_2v991750 [Rhizophagus irregularis DAOM 181602=DAOM 197198]
MLDEFSTNQKLNNVPAPLFSFVKSLLLFLNFIRFILLFLYIFIFFFLLSFISFNSLYFYYLCLYFACILTDIVIKPDLKILIGLFKHALGFIGKVYQNRFKRKLT